MTSTQGAGTGLFGEINHPCTPWESGRANNLDFLFQASSNAPQFMLFLSYYCTKYVDNYSNIYSLWYTCMSGPIVSCLSDRLVDIVSDLPLLSLSILIIANPSLSGIWWSLLYLSMAISKASSSALWMIPLLEYSLIKWYRALYFQVVCGFPENDKGQTGQCIGVLVHGILLEETAAFLYCMVDSSRQDYTIFKGNIHWILYWGLRKGHIDCT